MGRLLVVGAVAANEVGALDFANVGEIVGRRHSGELAELLVEVGVVGKAEVVDNGGKHTLVERLYHLCGVEETLGANHLLRRHSHVFGENASELPLTEACNVAKTVECDGRVAVDGVAHGN